MSTIDLSNEAAVRLPHTGTVEFKLEVAIVPVSDADRAKQFYASLGWREDADFVFTDDFRVLQFTPPGSEASIIFGTGVTAAAPGSIDRLLLAVEDIDAAREQLLARGAEVSEVFHDAGGGLGGGFHAGTEGRAAGPDPEGRSYGSYASFSDPDGNGWLLQEIGTRLPGRVTGARYAGPDDLAEALTRAATAHGEHEARTGEHDAEWPEWYAAYMVAEQTGQELPA